MNAVCLRRAHTPSCAPKSAILIVGLALVFLAPSLSPAQSNQGIVAVVNNHVISRYDLDQQLKLFYASADIEVTPEMEKDLERRILKNLVEQVLKSQAAREASVSVKNDEIARALTQAAQANNMNAIEFLQNMKKRDVEAATLEEQFRVRLAWERTMRRNLAGRIVIGEQDVADRMRQLEASKKEPRYLMREILVPYPQSAPEGATPEGTSEEQVLARARQIRKQMEDGANFAVLAQQLSAAPSAAVGGDIGWVTLDDLRKPLRDAVSKLAVGTLSQPVLTEDGAYIVVVLNKERYGEANPLRHELDLYRVQIGAREAAVQLQADAEAEAATPRGAEKPVAQKSAPKTKAWRKLLPGANDNLTPPTEDKPERAQAKPVTQEAVTARLRSQWEALRDGFTGCGALPALAEKIGLGEHGAVGMVAVGRLSERYRKVLEPLQAGELSPPIPSPAGLEVFAVCRRKDDVGVELDQEQVRRSLFNERLQMEEQRLLRNLHRDAVIEYRIARLAPRR